MRAHYRDGNELRRLSFVSHSLSPLVLKRNRNCCAVGQLDVTLLGLAQEMYKDVGGTARYQYIQTQSTLNYLSALNSRLNYHFQIVN